LVSQKNKGSGSSQVKQGRAKIQWANKRRNYKIEEKGQSSFESIVKNEET